MIILILRSTGAIVLSLAVAIAMVVGVEVLSSVLHPWPEDFAGTREEVARQVESYPAWILALLGGVGWGGTMLVSTYLATRLGSRRHPAHGYGVATFAIAMVIFNLSMLPYPVWFWVFMLVMMPAAAFLGIHLGKARPVVN